VPECAKRVVAGSTAVTIDGGPEKSPIDREVLCPATVQQIRDGGQIRRTHLVNYSVADFSDLVAMCRCASSIVECNHDQSSIADIVRGDVRRNCSPPSSADLLWRLHPDFHEALDRPGHATLDDREI